MKQVKQSKVFILSLIFLLLASNFAGIESAFASQSDGTPPEIQSASVSDGPFSIGDEVKFQANISDDLSGVRIARLNIQSPGGNRTISLD
ncbi:hypothetical protein, partial [Bacillus daqingensis]